MYVNQKKFSRTYRASFDEIFRFTQGLALQLRGCVDSFDAIFDQTAGSEVPMVESQPQSDAKRTLLPRMLCKHSKTGANRIAVRLACKLWLMAVKMAIQDQVPSKGG